MSIELRPYQNKLANLIRRKLAEKYKHILVQLPTGGGKTIVFSYIVINAIKKGNKAFILTDREELLKQASGSILNFGSRSGLLKAGTKSIDYQKDVYVGMSQTLRNRLKDKKWRDFIKNDIDIFIIDEAHIQEFNYIFEDGILDDKIVLGFTATPYRSGKMRQLGLDYQTMAEGPSTRELIQTGYLLNCDMYSLESPDLDGVTINQRTGDYNASSMFNRFNSVKTYSGLVNNYKKYANNTKMIVFCVNIEHCIKTCIELNNAGISAKFLASEKTEPKPPENSNNLFFDGSETEEEVAKWAKYNEELEKYNSWKDAYNKYSGTRSSIKEDFKNDKFKVLVNVDIFTKGFDEPSIETVAILRATKSVTLWLQMLGRGSRLFPGQDNFIVLDFGGNKDRLGQYDELRQWSLWHEEGKKGNGVPPLKECGIDAKGRAIKSSNEVKKGCGRLIMASSNMCPFCGFKYPDKGSAAEVELTLSSIIDDEGVSLIVKPISKMSWDELETYRAVKKYKQPWIWRKLWDRGGEDELRAFAEDRRWSTRITNQAVNYCKSISQSFNFS